MLPETAHLERHLGNMGAVRIYNVGKVLDTKLYPEEHGSFSLLIEDSHKPNAGIYDIEYEKGTAKVTKRSGGNADISLSAAAAARLLISGVSGGFEALGYMNGVKVFNGNNDFLRAFPAVDTFFNDGF